MQLINVELISDVERHDGDGRFKITVRYVDGTEQTRYARAGIGDDALAQWLRDGEHFGEDTHYEGITNPGDVIVVFRHRDGQTIQATFQQALN